MYTLIQGRNLRTLILIILVSQILTFQSFSKSILVDTIWSKTLDQKINHIELLNNDSVLVLNGSIFIDAKTSQEIARVKGYSNDKLVCFHKQINNQSLFIKSNVNGNKFYILKLEDFTIVDSLEPRPLVFDKGAISSDDKYFTAFSKDSIYTWDLINKKIVKSIPISKAANVESVSIFDSKYNCNDSKFYSIIAKSYKISPEPNYKSVSVFNLMIFDTEKFDSIDVYEKAHFFSFENNCNDLWVNYFVVNKSLKKYSIDSHSEQKVFETSGLTFTDFKISKDQKYLISASLYEKRINIWDIEEGKLLNHYDSLNFITVDISSNNKEIYSSNDRTLYKIKNTLENLNEIENMFEKTNKSQQISIYPNPFENKITINIDNLEDSSKEIRIYNQLGIEIIKIEDYQNLESINLEYLDNGLYFLEVENKIYKILKY